MKLFENKNLNIQLATSLLALGISGAIVYFWKKKSVVQNINKDI